MRTAKVFMSGNSQAVRLPKEFKLDVSEVDIFRQGDDIVLRPAKRSFADVIAQLGRLQGEFMVDGRDLSKPTERENF
ncbi:MAG: antitoxin [Aeromicrobium sp.]|nr:antitoxin [Burkholderiales bacterium]